MLRHGTINFVLLCSLDAGEGMAVGLNEMKEKGVDKCGNKDRSTV